MKHYECRECMPDGDASPCTLSYHEDTATEPIECPYSRGCVEPKWKLVDPDGKKDWCIAATYDFRGSAIWLVDVYTSDPITWVGGIDLEEGVMVINPNLQADLENGGYTTSNLKFTNGLLETRTP